MARAFVRASADHIDTGAFTVAGAGSELTVGCWFKVTSHTAGFQALVARHIIPSYPDNSTFALGVDDTGKLYGFTVNNSLQLHFATGTTVVSDDTWYHGCMRRTTALGQETIKLYLNGSQEASISTAGSVQAVANNILFGASGTHASPTEALGGALAEVFLANTAYDPSTIGAIGTATTPDKALTYSPDHYWALVGTDAPEPDSVGGANGTVTGATQTAGPLGAQANVSQLAGGVYATTGATVGDVFTPGSQTHIDLPLAGAYATTGATITGVYTPIGGATANSDVLTGGVYATTGAGLADEDSRVADSGVYLTIFSTIDGVFTPASATAHVSPLDGGSYATTGADVSGVAVGGPVVAYAGMLGSGSYRTDGSHIKSIVNGVEVHGGGAPMGEYFYGTP